MASYLVQQYGLSVDAALQAFREARPPGVRHAHFTAELRRRYELHTSHTCASPQPHPALAEAAGAEEAPAPQPSPALMSGWLREAAGAGQGGYAATPGSLLGARGGGGGSARQRLSGRLLVVEGDGEGAGSRVVMIEKNESLDLSLAQVGLAPLAQWWSCLRGKGLVKQLSNNIGWALRPLLGSDCSRPAMGSVG